MRGNPSVKLHSISMESKELGMPPPGDIAHGLADIASILDELNEKEITLFLLQHAFNILGKSPNDMLVKGLIFSFIQNEISMLSEMQIGIF
jgi:hypothetical protein